MLQIIAKKSRYDIPPQISDNLCYTKTKTNGQNIQFFSTIKYQILVFVARFLNYLTFIEYSTTDTYSCPI